MGTIEATAMPSLCATQTHNVSIECGASLPRISGKRFSSPQLQQSLFKAALESSGTAILICTNAAGGFTIVYANAAVLALTGYDADELHGRSWSFLVKRDVRERHLEGFRDELRAGESTDVTLQCLRKNGSELRTEFKTSAIRGDDGEITHYVVSMRDITEVQQRHELLKYFADHDSLTGLPNRRVLFDRFDQALERYRRHGEGFTIAFVDLNRFKEINDEFGHATGDEVLQHVARCLKSSIRACDTAARYGGDEFVLLLTGTSDVAAVHHTLQRALRFLDEPLVMHGKQIKVACSIGVAFCPRDGEHTNALLGEADSSMYRAKNGNRWESCVYGL